VDAQVEACLCKRNSVRVYVCYTCVPKHEVYLHSVQVLCLVMRLAATRIQRAWRLYNKRLRTAQLLHGRCTSYPGPCRVTVKAKLCPALLFTFYCTQLPELLCTSLSHLCASCWGLCCSLSLSVMVCVSLHPCSTSATSPVPSHLCSTGITSPSPVPPHPCSTSVTSPVQHQCHLTCVALMSPHPCSTSVTSPV
jgi:hypothetical protein